jgi:RNA polymerase sigma-70 factor (ECF subfamily)
MTDHEADRRRVRSVLAGDSGAFDEFFNEYFPRLYRFVLPRVEYCIADAQDLCQETLLRALRRLSTYRGEAALYSWICQIAANQVSDFWQRRRRDGTHVVFAEDDSSVQAVLATLHASEADSPESRRYNTEIPRLVQATLDNLPGRYGDALEWKYLDGLSVADVAHRLGVSIAAAQSVLQRARVAFREAFTAIGDVAVHDWLGPNGLRDSEV